MIRQLAENLHVQMIENLRFCNSSKRNSNHTRIIMFLWPYSDCLVRQQSPRLQRE